MNILRVTEETQTSGKNRFTPPRITFRSTWLETFLEYVQESFHEVATLLWGQGEKIKVEERRKTC
ncbi:hypothetical protein E2C01_034774 [Portunus trituberculatus]|uniref:Uncharacterized protein n=1 Tax=Portunus trituberculatus TaxID=210409 RepID=A0A5B7F7U2_PORTR|nr:hypothetical protein [Portunus trituberculatus]